ncbi:MAG: hypothetical protein KKH01_03210 [Firmicutes bacterium]|nr:hypothetical protein [Bacillota bacterium]
MKKILAYKSQSEIISSIVLFVLLIISIFLILMNYKFVLSDIAQAIQVILYVILIVTLMTILQLIIIILKPKVMMLHDDEAIYYYKNKKKFITIKFDEIQNMYAKVSLWTKPFLVYTAIVIMTEKKTFYLRHMSKMNEIKELIQHIAYHEE